MKPKNSGRDALGIPYRPAKDSLPSQIALAEKLDVFLAADYGGDAPENLFLLERRIVLAQSVSARNHAGLPAQRGEANNAMREETALPRGEHDLPGPETRKRVTLHDENVTRENARHHARTSRHDSEPAVGAQHLFGERHLYRCTFFCHFIASDHG
jgi:hypothetical protein